MVCKLFVAPPGQIKWKQKQLKLFKNVYKRRWLEPYSGNTTRIVSAQRTRHHTCTYPPLPVTYCLFNRLSHVSVHNFLHIGSWGFCYLFLLCILISPTHANCPYYCLYPQNTPKVKIYELIVVRAELVGSDKYPHATRV